MTASSQEALLITACTTYSWPLPPRRRLVSTVVYSRIANWQIARPNGCLHTPPISRRSSPFWRSSLRRRPHRVRRRLGDDLYAGGIHAHDVVQQQDDRRRREGAGRDPRGRQEAATRGTPARGYAFRGHQTRGSTGALTYREWQDDDPEQRLHHRGHRLDSARERTRLQRSRREAAQTHHGPVGRQRRRRLVRHRHRVHSHRRRDDAKPLVSRAERRRARQGRAAP